MILDHDAKTMLSLTEHNGQKSGFKMKMTDETYEYAKNSYEKNLDEGDKDFDGSWEKTGRTKTMLNMTVEEIKVKSSEGSGTVWVTNDLDLNFASLMGIMGGGNAPNKAGRKDKFSDIYYVGFPLGSKLHKL